ncbi:MAG: L-2-hydroxyglutarate oxidase [Pirellulaceae bacterium]|nr:L-2-hydroxyglutarate oxidase [Pirellulaceae bacterium]
MQADVTIVGGGIVGLATAYAVVQRHPGSRVIVLEKERQLGLHQTGHNSGVLHTGIYYKPGSLKAQNCRDGRKAMVQFCRDHEIDHEICGKVIVAVSRDEVARLQAIYDRGQENGVRCEVIDRARLLELEPYAAGVKAIHVPDAGIVSFGQVCQRLADIVRRQDGQVLTGARVIGIDYRQGRLTVESTVGDVETRCLVNCAGLHCDRITAMTGVQPAAKIVPFRGEYYELKPASHHLCRNLIYPVPDPAFPFLGVHFTRMIDGSIECGPNAVLAFAREGYRKRDINPGDFGESLGYSGFQKVAGKYWRMGAGEMWRSFSKGAFVKALQRLMPEIRREHLTPARAGVRAQAIAPDGRLVDDFLIQQAGPIVHVNNAPSPGATSSLNIGKTIVEKLPGIN